MIGSLLYLTASMSDLMLSVCVCARFQSNLKESHLCFVKRIIRYVKGVFVGIIRLLMIQSYPSLDDEQTSKDVINSFDECFRYLTAIGIIMVREWCLEVDTTLQDFGVLIQSLEEQNNISRPVDFTWQTGRNEQEVIS